MQHILSFDDFLNEIRSQDIKDNAEENRLERSNGVIVNYKGIRHRTAQNRIKTLFFDVYDPNGSGNHYKVEVQIPDYRQLALLRRNISISQKIEKSFNDGELNVFCPCNDFKYQGYKYMATAGNYYVPKKEELRYPSIKNPELTGTVCKHVLAVVDKINDFVSQIEIDVKDYIKQEKQKRKIKEKEKLKKRKEMLGY